MTMENEYSGLGAFNMNISTVLFKLIFDLPYSLFFNFKKAWQNFSLFNWRVKNFMVQTAESLLVLEIRPGALSVLPLPGLIFKYY